MMHKRVPVSVQPGTVPEPDMTALSSVAWIDGDKYRFYGGLPQSIGGSLEAELTATISGVPRLLYGFRDDDNKWIIVGTHTRLHSVLGGEVTNISPVVTSTTSLPNNPVGTLYISPTVGQPVFGTTNGSTDVTLRRFSSTVDAFRAGDTVIISGASGTYNGIPAAELNATHIVRSVGTYPTISVTTAATSTSVLNSTGITQATYIVYIQDTAHGLSDGDRVKLAGSSGTVGGVPDTDINKEQVIRDVDDVDFYAIVVSTISTSSATGGGASVTRREQIAAGDADSTNPEGWGVGEWGDGEWGDPPVDTTSLTIPRIWSADRFGNDLVLCPGGEKPIYKWTGSTATAPAVISAAPTDIKWILVDNNKIVALGPDNRIRCCDDGDDTDWTPAAGNASIDRTVYAADEWMSAIKVRDFNLLFTVAGQVWELRYIGGNDVYLTRQIDVQNGMVSPKAGKTVNGISFWMGKDNFYVFTGSSVEILPSTVRNYVFEGDNKINIEQAYKVHARYVKKYNEIWWHYPSGDENDRYVIYSIAEQTWAIGAMDRTAGEENGQLFNNPLAIKSTGTLYSEEENASTTDTTATITVTTKLRAQASDSQTTGALTLESDTEKLDFRIHGRQRKIRVDFVTGAGVDGFFETNYGIMGEGDDTFHLLGLEPDNIQTPELFRMGSWYEKIAIAGRR
jgi:hypothetical protein